MEPFIGIPIRNFLARKEVGGGLGRGEGLRSDQTQTQREVQALLEEPVFVWQPFYGFIHTYIHINIYIYIHICTHTHEST